MAKRIPITSEEESKIVFMYVEQNKTIKEISEILHRGLKTIRKVLIKNSVAIKLRNAKDFSREEQSNIVNMYLSGSTLAKTASEFNCSSPTITVILKLNNIELRGKKALGLKRKYNLDTSFFDINNLSSSAMYWLGFIFADGFCSEGSKAKYVVELCLSAKDEKHLEKLKHRLKLDCNLYRFISRTECVRLRISSKVVNQQILDLGKKKDNLSVLPVPITRDFLRGLIDGDGCFGSYLDGNKQVQQRIEFLGGLELLEQVRDYLFTNLGCSPNDIRTWNKNLYCLRYSNKEAIKIVRHAYKNAPYFDRLERKYENYLAYFSGV